MDVTWLRRYCLSLPHTTETVQWGDNLVLKIAVSVRSVLLDMRMSLDTR